MPSGAGSEAVRLVLDESSFDFRDMEDAQVEEHLRVLAESLGTLSEQRRSVDEDLQAELTLWRSQLWEFVQCRPGLEMYELLASTETIDRDLRRLLWTALDHLPEWDEPEHGEYDVVIGGAESSFAMSVGHAVVGKGLRSGIACLACTAVDRRGFLPVRAADHDREVYFFQTPGDLLPFWRSLFESENIAEKDFFRWALLAFPGLTCVPELSFGGFEGSYQSTRARTVEILAALSDHFLRIFREHNGVPYEVQSALGQYHLDVSFESTKTRSSDKLMKHRERIHLDRPYRCEWHAKLEPHRNRIHFFVPGPEEAEQRLLVGHMVRHFPT